MALSGQPDGPPLCPAGFGRGLDEVVASIARWSAETGAVVEVDWPELVTVRAALLGLRRRGRVSPNGTCRLLAGPDGFMALNLPRPDDLAAVGAIVEGDAVADPWEAVERALARSSVTDVVARARLVGVPATPLGQGEPGASPWSVGRCWPRAHRRAIAELRIVDLSSMWAGPLAATLLARAGGGVVKVETTSRPDGARAVPGLYRALHDDDQPVVVVDIDTLEGRRQLGRLVNEADVVIESSRRRALEQLGCGPDDVEARPGRVWVSVTGYGREAPGRHWVAFGDDAAVAGGLVAWEDESHPVFCGDAVADPLSGMMAAAAAFEALATGGGVVLDVSMQACARSLAPPAAVASAAAERDTGGWYVTVGGNRVSVRDRAAEAQLPR